MNESQAINKLVKLWKLEPFIVEEAIEIYDKIDERNSALFYACHIKYLASVMNMPPPERNEDIDKILKETTKEFLIYSTKLYLLDKMRSANEQNRNDPKRSI